MSEITNTPQTFVEYSPRTWVNGESITADKLNNIEQGIVRLSNQIKDALSIDIDDSSSSASQETELAAASSLAEKIVSVAEGLDGTFLKTTDADDTYLYKNNPTADDDEMRTMTGNLIISKTTPKISFRKANSLEEVGAIQHKVVSDENRMIISQRVDESAGDESYALPAPSEQISDASYEILTTKNYAITTLDASDFVFNITSGGVTINNINAHRWGPFISLSFYATNSGSSAITTETTITGTVTLASGGHGGLPISVTRCAAYANTAFSGIAMMGNGSSNNFGIKIISGSWAANASILFNFTYMTNSI